MEREGKNRLLGLINFDPTLKFSSFLDPRLWVLSTGRLSYPTRHSPVFVRFLSSPFYHFSDAQKYEKMMVWCAGWSKRILLCTSF